MAHRGSAGRKIADNVHGAIELTPVECAVVDTPSFQRLRRVKQLGLAYYVYPGANYSRFSHSIGACAIAGKVLQQLRAKYPQLDDDHLVQRYRLAALLHDVGHYPFSHTMEHALKDYSSRALIRPKSSARRARAPEHSSAQKWINHERVGELVVTRDPAMSKALRSHGFTPEEVASVFNREFVHETFPVLTNLVSSDLDVDRLDYLIRTAHHSGLPYGAVDLDYLIGEMCLDEAGRLTLSHKAMRAAEHLLLCRYFDYMQVSYHKTVAGFEKVLEDLIQLLVTKGMISCAEGDIEAMLNEGTWLDFDDTHIESQLRDLRRETRSDATRDKLDCVSLRRPPKLVFSDELLVPSSSSRARWLQMQKIVRAAVAQAAKKFDVSEGRWYVWEKATTMTRIGSQVPVSDLDEARDADADRDRDRYEQAVRILDRDKEHSTAIVEIPGSLMSLLSSYTVLIVRVFVLLPERRSSIRPRIEEWFRSEVPSTHDDRGR